MTAPITTAEKIVSEIAAAEAATTERDNRSMKIGDVAHQGDVYVARVTNHEQIYDLNKLLGTARKRGKKTERRQAAPGTTQGARHMIVGDDVTIYAPPDEASPLEGPTVVAKGEWALSHPEHATHRFGAGAHVVTYQRELAEEMRRVAD